MPRAVQLYRPPRRSAHARVKPLPRVGRFEHLGLWVRAVRTAMGLSQEKFATALEPYMKRGTCSTSSVARWERGPETGSPVLPHTVEAVRCLWMKEGPLEDVQPEGG